MAIEEDLSEWETASSKKMIAYGFGYVVVNYLLGGGWGRVFYFYQNEMRIGLGFIVAATVIFAIWNMVNDPLLGFLTDKPRKLTRKWGLRAPWVVLMTAPMLIAYFFIWTPPQGDVVLMFVYFIIITCLFDTFFSIFNDHVYGGFTNQFPSEYERRKAFAIAAVLLGAVLTFMGVLTSLIIKIGDPETYVTAALLMVVFLIVFSLIQFSGLRESKEMKEMFIKTYEEAKKQSFFSVAKKALGQRNFFVSLIGYTVSATCAQLVSASTLYMFNDVYGLPIVVNLFPVISGAVAFILIIPFWYNYSRKHGFKKTYWVCFILHGISFIPYLFIGGTGWDPGLTIILITIFAATAGLCYSGEVIMLMPVASDTYDEVALVMGRRQDATFVGIRTFFFRIAFLVQALVFFTVFTVTGYVETTVPLSQNIDATFGVRVIRALIPMILIIIMGLLFRKFYALEGEKKAEMVKKLKEAGLYRA